MRIVVDADACPKSVLSICFCLGREYSLPVLTVANHHHIIDSPNHVLVGGDPEETDIKIANLVTRADIVVTQDWGLAAIVLGRGAYCLSLTGMEYRAGTIEFMLEERDLKARHRRGGGRTKGPRKRTAGDDERFKAQLEQIICRIQPSS